MKALRAREDATPNSLALEEIDVPKPGVQGVLVRVHAAGVTRIDVAAAHGKARNASWTLGRDFAGQVVEGGDW